MAHTIELAPSGRAKCRGCGERIAKDSLRLGLRLPNPFVESEELTLWLHLVCGAYKRPEAYLEAARTATEPIPDAERLEKEARRGVEHERLARLNGAERAPTGRASCRHCREAIEKGKWRLSLVFFEEVEGRFQPAGFLHLSCAAPYLGTSDVVPRIRVFSPSLTESDLSEIAGELRGSPG